MQNNRKQGLKVEIINGKLQISIGIDYLKFAIEHSPDPSLSKPTPEGEFYCYDIIDADQFVEDIIKALLSEAEDGTNLIHVLLENAAYVAIEQGSAGIADEMKEHKYDDCL